MCHVTAVDSVDAVVWLILQQLHIIRCEDLITDQLLALYLPAEMHIWILVSRYMTSNSLTAQNQENNQQQKPMISNENINF